MMVASVEESKLVMSIKTPGPTVEVHIAPSPGRSELVTSGVRKLKPLFVMSAESTASVKKGPHTLDNR